MPEANEPLLQRHVVACLGEIFLAYSVPLGGEMAASTPTDDRRGKLAAVIGFTGEGMRGALALVMPVELVRALYPIPEKTPTEEELSDWAGEFANQLLGRLRNRLLPRGVEIHVSMPKTMLAEELRLGGTATAQACNLRFAAGNQQHIEVWFDALIAPGIDLASVAPSAPEPVKEGELLFF